MRPLNWKQKPGSRPRTSTALSLLATAVLVSSACSANEVHRHERRATKDGVSAGGHVWVADVALAKMPEATEVAIRGTVTKIESSVLNTQSGAWDPPAGMSPQELHELFAELAPYTRVHLRVDEVLGERAESSFTTPVGTDVVVTLLGGSADITLSPSQAEAIGITVPIKEGEGEPNQGPENQMFPTEAMTLSISMDPAAFLREGDSAVAFLTSDSIDTYPGPKSLEVIVSLVPDGFGFFRQNDQGEFVSASNEEVVPTDQLMQTAQSVSDEAGPVDPLATGGW